MMATALLSRLLSMWALGAADDSEVRGGLKNLLGNLRRGADREPVKVGDHFEETVLVLSEVGLEGDVEAAVAKNLDGGFGKLVGDEDTGTHG